jgi:membrane protease YdiL (CAAX protease family)
VLIQIGWLVVLLGAGALWVRRDAADYQKFVQLADSPTRQRFFRRWIITSFLALTGASLISLGLVGALLPFDPFPAAFEPLQPRFQLPQRELSPEMMFGIAIGISLNVALLVLLQRWRSPGKGAAHQGDLDPLIPRNGREALYGLALSINAGFGEELFFRLALPLLLFHISGSLLLAFAFATLCFGLAHLYQGMKGVIATTLAGVVLTLVYLRTGSLLQVMATHATIDIIALFVRPRLLRLAGRLWAPRAAPLA